MPARLRRLTTVSDKRTETTLAAPTECNREILRMKKNTEKDKKVHAHESDDDRLNWRYQDKQYNESFKKWRREKQNSVGFYFVAKPDRLTYQDGLGFINDYPEAREAKAFRKVLAVLGLILIYHVTVDAFFTYLLPFIMEKMGMNIYYSIFSGQRYGSSAIIMLLDILSQVLGRVVPAAVLVKHLEIPLSVILPTSITNKSMFRFAAPAALLVASVCSLMSYFYDRVLSVFKIDTESSYAVSGSAEEIMYAVIIHILIIPIISELCTHGVVLQLVRQFGDGTALFFASLIIAASTYDIVQMPFAAVTSFVAGYFIIRTGSVITGIIMRIVTRAYIYALCCIRYYTEPLYGTTVMTAFIFLTLTVGLVSVIWFLYNRSDRFTMTIRPSYMSFSSKILEAATSIPIVIWIAMTFLVTAVNIKFTS